jgi:hypothetical protein
LYQKLVFAVTFLAEILVVVSGEVFHKNALDEGVAAFEAMCDSIFVLDFDEEVTFVIGVVVVVGVNDADLITEADVVFEAGFTADDYKEDLIWLEAGFETGGEFGGFTRGKFEI